MASPHLEVVDLGDRILISGAVPRVEQRRAVDEVAAQQALGREIASLGTSFTRAGRSCCMQPVEETALRAIANPRRRAILRLVWDRERSSGDIASHFDVTWPSISQNLQVLERAGLIRARRQGTSRLYRADRDRLRPLEAVLRAMWESDLDRLAELAEDDEQGRST